MERLWLLLEGQPNAGANPAKYGARGASLAPEPYSFTNLGLIAQLR